MKAHLDCVSKLYTVTNAYIETKERRKKKCIGSMTLFIEDFRINALIQGKEKKKLTDRSKVIT